MQPQIIIFPSSNLTVPWTSLSINPCPACFYIHCFPSDPNLLILVSSDQITFCQSSRVHSLCFKAKINHCFLCTAVSNGFFFFVTALNECLLRTFLAVCEGTELGMMVLICFIAWTALAAFPVVICIKIEH